MKKLGFIFVFFGFFVLFADQGDEDMCDYASQENTNESWLAYLKEYPTGRCSGRARAILKQRGVALPGEYNRDDAKDEEACKNARLRNNVRAWRNYLNNHPNGWCKDEAQNFLSDHEYENENEDRRWQRQIENRDYEDRKQERNEEKYNRMAQDQKACEIARQTNSWQLWAQYYRDFGEQGSCAFEAKQQYQILKNQEEQNEKLNRQREEQQREYNRQQQAIQQQENNMAREREIIESRRASAGGSRYWSEKYRGTWAEAKRKCENLREGGYSDWRLPTISELRTLITYSACSRTYPGGECPITDSNPNYFSYKKGKCHCNGGKRNPLGDNERFWSSTGSNENGRFWYVFFGSGSIYADKNGDPYDSNYFRCTR